MRRTRATAWLSAPTLSLLQGLTPHSAPPHPTSATPSLLVCVRLFGGDDHSVRAWQAVDVPEGKGATSAWEWDTQGA